MVVLGTRPEIVKLAHITKILGDEGEIVHTGQHYDPGLSDSFFDQLDLPEPEVFLEIGGESRGRQIGLAVTALDGVLEERRPAAVVVQGDRPDVGRRRVRGRERHQDQQQGREDRSRAHRWILSRQWKKRAEPKLLYTGLSILLFSCVGKAIFMC